MKKGNTAILRSQNASQSARAKMANENVSRIMQNKPHLRYSLAFVHIKVRYKGCWCFRSARVCVRARFEIM